MLIVVNLKSYDVDPVAVTEAARAVAEDTAARIVVAPQAAAIDAVAETGVETWAQHVAPTGGGSHTGSQRAAAAARAGATGTILNHSERRLELADLAAAIDRAAETGLETVACANDPEQVAAVTHLDPDAVAVEPPELIGSDRAVSTADPAIVRDAVAAAESVDPTCPVLCGAGISTGADVAAARDLGADGVLLASGVAKAEDPEAALADLVTEL
ncbi:triose-phosphate isomerase [Halobacteriales archaeon SW_7_68_16]|nr:MAG: triose-phosphate isomerase [Halobacteriales archaeon SW_7_68_16]